MDVGVTYEPFQPTEQPASSQRWIVVRKPIEPYIIDIEASGFGGLSYPIEVGIALEGGHKFFTLISPAPDWTYWDADAERIHHISRSTLQTSGRPAYEVAEKLNELLEGKTLYSDGWVVDKPWLTTLFYAARTPMRFSVSPLEMILSEEQMAQWHDVKNAVLAESKLIRHRASNDAWVIQQTFKKTLTMQRLTH